MLRLLAQQWMTFSDLEWHHPHRALSEVVELHDYDVSQLGHILQKL